MRAVKTKEAHNDAPDLLLCDPSFRNEVKRTLDIVVGADMDDHGPNSALYVRGRALRDLGCRGLGLVVAAEVRIASGKVYGESCNKDAHRVRFLDIADALATTVPVCAAASLLGRRDFSTGATECGWVFGVGTRSAIRMSGQQYKYCLVRDTLTATTWETIARNKGAR